MLTTRLNDKTCPVCSSLFTQVRPMQAVCSPICASRKVRADKKAEREEFKRRKEAIKTIPDYIKEAQHAFNAFIRERDKSKPCICCGLPLQGISGSTGGDFDCGHYRSVGSAPQLRFDERNAHGQRKQCNRYGAGRAVDYRIGLIARIGLAEVEQLESDNRVHKWNREELIAIRDLYRAKLKELKAGRTE